MSSLWTPGGEVPIERSRPGAEPEPPQQPPSTAAEPPRREPTEEELRAHAEQLQAMYLQTPAQDIVVQHAMGLYELAVVHLSQEQPDLAAARLAIDALGALLDGLRGRLGPAEDQLTSVRSQLQMAVVQLASGAPGEPATPDDGE